MSPSDRFCGDWERQAVLIRLGRGRDHAVTKAELVAQLGSSWNERAVKRAVQALRMDGYLIASGNEGYYLDENVDEWLRRQRSQIVSMARTYRKVRAVARQRSARVEQTTLFDAA